jgi:hypothetical protein
MYILIILLAGYLIARFAHSFTNYAPIYYEPKDFERNDWLRKQE